MKNKKTPKDKVYRLLADAAPLSLMISTRGSLRQPLLWYDEEKNENRPLRYARNQKSPFEDEQDGNAILEPIIFEDGLLMVQKTNPVLQEFLEYHPGNGVTYEEADEEQDASEVVERLNIEVDALVAARQLDLDQIEIVSRVLFGHKSSTITTQELKRDLLIYAKQDPEGFLDILDDSSLKLKSQAQSFFDGGLLTFRKNKTEVWYNTASNKKRMLTVPFGGDAIDSVTSYLQTDDGIESLKMLESNL
tara:strand:- start:651 stop:1394 length:744 start_codon:yes stop_codon:yes gene_type:complete